MIFSKKKIYYIVHVRENVTFLVYATFKLLCALSFSNTLHTFYNVHSNLIFTRQHAGEQTASFFNISKWDLFEFIAHTCLSQFCLRQQIYDSK